MRWLANASWKVSSPLPSHRVLAEDSPRRRPDVLAADRVAELAYALEQPGQDQAAARRRDGQQRQRGHGATGGGAGGERSPPVAGRQRAGHEDERGGRQRQPGAAGDRDRHRRPRRHGHDGESAGRDAAPVAERARERVDDQRQRHGQVRRQEVRVAERRERAHETAVPGHPRIQDGIDAGDLHQRIDGRARRGHHRR